MRKKRRTSNTLREVVGHIRSTSAWGGWCRNDKTGRYDVLAKWSAAEIYCANPKVRVRIVVEADFKRLLRAANANLERLRKEKV